MFKLSFAVAALALASTAVGKASKPYRQTCVDANGQVKQEGAIWYEGVNGCLKVQCTNGVAVGTDSCKCVYPDNTSGGSGDVWYSVHECKSCKCNTGTLACEDLLNCVKSSSSAVATAPITITSTVGVVNPTSTIGLQCAGPDNVQMNLGDMYIEGCRNCTCTLNGLNCYGMVDCPYLPTTNIGSGCYTGWNSQAALVGSNSYVAEGYTFQEDCNTCTCVNSVFSCNYDYSRCGALPTATGEIVTVTVTPEEPVETDVDDIIDNGEAEKDCDVDDGIVVNGGSYTNACGAACTCLNGALDCPDCPGDDDASVAAGNTTEYTCIATDGKEVENGGSYMAQTCTNCTCVNGVFNCVQTCERDCTTSDGKTILHGKSTSATCSKCKCNDATLICENTCAGQVCKVPNSSTTIAPGSKKTIDGCINCSCSSSVLLSCRDNCPKSTDCVCNARILKDGKTRTTDCKKCECKNGSLSCKNVC